MKIDFKNLSIEHTLFNLKLRISDRADNWTIEDELIQLSIAIQKKVMRNKYNNKDINYWDWQEKIHDLANETANKSYDPICEVTQNNWGKTDNSYQIIKEQFDCIDIIPVKNCNEPFISEEGKKKYLEDKAHEKAVKEAKYKLAKEQREKEEQEELEQREAKDNIIIPFENYGK